MKKLKRCLFIFLALASSSTAYAGDPGGPDIVWVNLDLPPSKTVDDAILKIVHAESPKCWNASDSYIYMKTRPAGITNDLVAKALIEKNISSMKKLSKLLASYGDKYVSGFDGIIAYKNGSRPHLISLTTGANHVEATNIRSLSVRDIEEAFCLIMPDVVRKP